MDRSPADVLAQPTRARLYALLRASVDPRDTAELAAALDLHPNGVRAHLERMWSAGLVTRSRAPQARGRPRDLWQVASGVPEGPHIAERTPSIRRRRGASAARGDELGRLADLRSGLRTYLAWAEAVAREHDLTAAQFQLALAIDASPTPGGPTLTELADALLLRHHSVVGLVDRAQGADVVERVRDPERSSRVHVRLTESGERRFHALAQVHLQELAELAPRMRALWGAFDGHSRV